MTSSNERTFLAPPGVVTQGLNQIQISKPTPISPYDKTEGQGALSSALTPDSDLDLLFEPELIPTSVKSVLHEDLHIRPLASTDYRRGHLDVLRVLTEVPESTEEDYVAQFNAQKAAQWYFTLVVVNRRTDRIVGVGCVFIEHKFVRGLGKAGHIEDIAVDKSMQGKKIGFHIINALTEISEIKGAYKTILNCSDANMPFYQKCGYGKKENEMAKYSSKMRPTPAPTPAPSPIPRL